MKCPKCGVEGHTAAACNADGRKAMSLPKFPRPKRRGKSVDRRRQQERIDQLLASIRRKKPRRDP